MLFSYANTKKLKEMKLLSKTDHKYYISDSSIHDENQGLGRGVGERGGIFLGWELWGPGRKPTQPYPKTATGRIFSLEFMMTKSSKIE